MSIPDATPILQAAETTLEDDLNSASSNSPEFHSLEIKLTAVELMRSIIAVNTSNGTISQMTTEQIVISALAENDKKPIDGASYDYSNEIFAEASTTELNEYLLELLLQ